MRTGQLDGVKYDYTPEQEDERDAEEALSPVVNYTTAKNFQIREVIIGLGKISEARTAIASGSDGVIEYWMHNDVFVISDPEIIFVKDALGLSDNALQNLFNNANQ